MELVVWEEAVLCTWMLWQPSEVITLEFHGGMVGIEEV